MSHTFTHPALRNFLTCLNRRDTIVNYVRRGSDGTKLEISLQNGREETAYVVIVRSCMYWLTTLPEAGRTPAELVDALSQLLMLRDSELVNKEQFEQMCGGVIMATTPTVARLSLLVCALAGYGCVYKDLSGYYDRFVSSGTFPQMLFSYLGIRKEEQLGRLAESLLRVPGMGGETISTLSFELDAAIVHFQSALLKGLSYVKYVVVGNCLVVLSIFINDSGFAALRIQVMEINSISIGSHSI